MPVAFELTGIREVQIQIFFGYFVDFRGPAARVSVEKRILASVPGQVPEPVVFRQFPVNFKNSGICADCDSPVSVIELGYAEIIGSDLFRYGGSLGRCQVVADFHVPSESHVEVVHHLPEHPAVGRRILDSVHEDMVVDHFVKNDIFEFRFGEVEDCADSQGEMFEADDFPEYVSFTDKGHLAQKCAGVGELDRYGGKRTVEAEFVEMVKRLSDVFDGRFHVDCFCKIINFEQFLNNLTY